MRALVIAIGFVSLLGTHGCGDTIVNVPTTPTPVPATPTDNTMEFRVAGNASLVLVRYSNPIDGLTQVTTALPYVATITTTRTTMFLSLEVTPLNYPTIITNPFTVAQIHVNGALFREASSVSFSSALLASGTWRK